MYKYLTIALLFVGGFSFSQENSDSAETAEDSLSGNNLIISWTLGEVVAGYGGFDKSIANQDLHPTRFTVTAVKETKAAQLVKIHPNPTADFVVVHLKEVKADELLLEDSSGNILMRKDLPKSTKSFELDLSKHEDGVYFLAITNDHNITLERFKIIKRTVK